MQKTGQIFSVILLSRNQTENSGSGICDVIIFFKNQATVFYSKNAVNLVP